jgi:hypothetical protein
MGFAPGIAYDTIPNPRRDLTINIQDTDVCEFIIISSESTVSAGTTIAC